MIQLFHNLRLAAVTVVEHVADDPIVLMLQISRRLPAGVVRRAANLVRTIAPQRSTTAAVLLACCASGDLDSLAQKFQALLATGRAGRKAMHAADIALAAKRTDWAGKLLVAVPPQTRKLPAVLARKAWFDGEMTTAVALLQGQAGAMSRQRNRLAAELNVFAGSTPRLPRPSATTGPNRTPRNPNRVLHLLTNSLPHTTSGYAQRTHSILTAQQEAGWEVLAVTRPGYPVQVGKLNAKAVDVVDGVTYQRCLPRQLGRGLDNRLQQQAEALLQTALKFQPTVLHTTTHFVNGLVAREVAKALDIPWVYEVRGQLADTWAAAHGPDARASERYRLFREREGEVMRSADLVVTLGQAMKQQIIAAGVQPDRVIITPNAVGGDFLREPMAPEQARQALGLPVDGQWIGTVSSLVDYEGLDDLVEAFASLAPERPELRLLIVGDGTAAPALKERLRRLGLTDRALFTGRVARDKTPLYHQALDVFVVPRKDLDVTRSVTPLKPVEALASARPVVASDLPALREIVDPGANGRLVQAGVPDALARGINELLADEPLRRGLGVAGRAGVLATRTWTTNAAVYDQAYKQLRKAS